MSNALTLIGYWRSEPGDGWPDPAGWVDERWDLWDQRLIAGYLSSGIRYEMYRGYSPCRLCGRQNGAAEYTDWTYVWPEGLAHYVRDHWVRLPDEVLEHIRRRTGELKAMGLDREWWPEVAGADHKR